MIHTEQHMILSLAATIYHPGVLLKLWFPQTLVFKNSLTSPSYRSKNLPKQINTKGNKLQWSLASLSKCPSLPMKYSIKQIAIFNSIAFLLWPSHKRLRKWKKNVVFFVMEKHWCHQSGVSVFPNFDQNFNLPSQTNWKKIPWLLPDLEECSISLTIFWPVKSLKIYFRIPFELQHHVVAEV